MIAALREASFRHPDRTAGLALAAVVFALFAPALLGQRVFFQRDIHAYWFPHIDNAVRAVAEGGWPAWTPYVAFGRPLLSDPSLQLFYPPTWLNLLVQPGTYYSIFAAMHCWGAGFGAYLLGRRVGLSPAAALLTGALWTASGPLLSAVNLFHHFAGAAWAAWVLLMLARALEAPTVARAAALGLVAGGQALAGSADLLLLTGLAAALQAGFFVAGPGPRGWRFFAAGRAAVIGVPLAALVGAAQWLPAFALLRGTMRAAQDPWVSTTWSVHPFTLADLFVPRLVAELPMTPELRAVLFEGRGPLLASLYLGLVSAVLAVLAWLGPAHPVRGWATAACALFVLAALGRHTIVYRYLAGAPPLSLVRYPVKYMLPAALFWMLLAGRGLDVWRGQWSEPLRRRGRCLLAACLVLGLVAVGASASMARPSAVPAKVALAGGTLLAVSALLRSRAARAAAPAGLTGAIAVLAAVDVAWAGRHVNPLAPAAFYRYRPPLAARLAETGGDVRLFVRQESAERLNDLLVRGPGGWDSEEGWALGAQDRLVPPLGARWRIAGSYDGDFTGLATPVYSMFSFVLPALERQAIALKFLRLGSVTHVSSLRERPFPGLEPLATFDSVFAGPVRLFRVPDPFPRAYVVGGARTAADEGAITAIGDPGFDPRREVLLPPGTPVAVSPAGFTSEARVSWRRMDSLGIAAESSGPGWLVVTEAWQRGWTARVDGAAAPVIRANGLFRAVPLPGGRHEVVLRYDPPGLRLGLALSLAGLAVGLVAVRRPAPEGRR